MIDHVSIFERFHKELFGANKGLDFSGMRTDPAASLASVCQLIKDPRFQTFESGFLLGLTVAYCAEKNPLRLEEIFKMSEAVRSIDNAKRNS